MMSFDGDVVIREVDLPPGVHGSIEEDPDGIANIYINQHDSWEERMKTLRHELGHHRLGHLRSCAPLPTLEEEAILYEENPA